MVRDMLFASCMHIYFDTTANTTKLDVITEIVTCFRPPIQATQCGPNLANAEVTLLIMESAEDMRSVLRWENNWANGPMLGAATEDAD